MMVKSVMQSSPTPDVPKVHGLDLDPETRCLHWHSPLDIIAIRMACCGLYYACKDCHQALAGHELKPWPRSEWHTPAILCGHCKTELTIEAYMASNNRCPNCHSAFNPGCRNHYHYYFATESEATKPRPDAPA